MKATEVIKRDHEAAKELFAKYRAADAAEREALEGKIFEALTAHETMEDTHFYPALREHKVEDTGIFSEIEREQRALEGEVLAARALPGDKQERLLSIMDQVLAHATKEEQAVLPKAEAALGADNEKVGKAMESDSAVAKVG